MTFERQITPQEEKEGLRKKIESAPERTREIVDEYLRRKPEEVYLPEKSLPVGEMANIEKEAAALASDDWELAVEYLFKVAGEKGILYAAEAAKKSDPAVMEEFHDRLVTYLISEKDD